MKKFNKLLDQPSKVIAISLIIFLIGGLGTKSKAFIPYVYEPNPKELSETGLSIGKTAAQLLQLGQAQEATRLASLAVRLQPNDDRLWAILAEAQIRSSMLDEASKSLAKAKELNPRKASLWFAEASLTLQQQKPKDAIISIQKGLKLEPNNAGAYFQLGNARLMQRNLRKALPAFQKAAKINPKFWEALNNQGIVLFEINKIKEAIHMWRKVLKISENAEPMLALAAALNQMKPENNESIKIAKAALAKNPNYVSPIYQHEQLWGQKLQQATKKLLQHPKLIKDVERALANSDVKMTDAQ